MRYAEQLLKKDLMCNLEIGRDDNDDIYLSYKNAYVSDGVVLAGVSGRGKTIELAAKDYIDKINGKTLVFDGSDKKLTLVFIEEEK